MRIRTAKDELPTARRRGVVANFMLMAATLKHNFDATVDLGRPVRAQVNHGRWLAECPECNGAELVDPTEPVFFCLTCGNKGIGGRLRRVRFPPDRAMVEAVSNLEIREEANQNWDPEVEDVAFLAAENVVFLQRKQPTLRQLTQPKRRGR